MRTKLLLSLTTALMLMSSAVCASDERAAALSRILVGQWGVVASDAASRLRIWEVTRVLAYEPNLYLAEGRYGFSDVDWTPVVAEIRDAEPRATIVFGTPVNNIFELTFDSDEKLSGTFRLRNRTATATVWKLKDGQRISQAPHSAVVALERPARETVWSASMSEFSPGKSSSPIAAPLPDNLVIRAPHSDVPRNWARFSGLWSGWACYFQGMRACDVGLAVLTIYGDRADIVHTWGDANRKSPSTYRTIGRFVGDELLITFSNKNIASYRFRPDGNLQLMLFLHGMSVDNSRVGVLTRETK